MAESIDALKSSHNKFAMLGKKVRIQQSVLDVY